MNHTEDRLKWYRIDAAGAADHCLTSYYLKYEADVVLKDLRARIEELETFIKKNYSDKVIISQLINELSAERAKVKKLREKINDIIEEESAKEDWDGVILKYAREALAATATDGGK